VGLGMEEVGNSVTMGLAKFSIGCDPNLDVEPGPHLPQQGGPFQAKCLGCWLRTWR
jgi:hypothetical protein